MARLVCVDRESEGLPMLVYHLGYNIFNSIMVYLSGMNGMRILTLFGLLSCLAYAATGQTPAEYQANYAKRIKLEVINGVYIPYDLDDAFSELERLSDPSGIGEFKAAPEDSIRRKLHFGLGRWILINWGLEEGSRISHYMKGRGVSLPDDMVDVIIITWHRHLNQQPIRFEDEVAIIEKRQAAEKAKRDAQSEIRVIEKRPHKE